MKDNDTEKKEVKDNDTEKKEVKDNDTEKKEVKDNDTDSSDSSDSNDCNDPDCNLGYYLAGILTELKIPYLGIYFNDENSEEKSPWGIVYLEKTQDNFESQVLALNQTCPVYKDFKATEPIKVNLYDANSKGRRNRIYRGLRVYQVKSNKKGRRWIEVPFRGWKFQFSSLGCDLVQLQRSYRTDGNGNRLRYQNQKKQNQNRKSESQNIRKFIIASPSKLKKLFHSLNTKRA